MNASNLQGWRIGDCGRTIYGPKSDQPAPVAIALLLAPTPRVSADDRARIASLIVSAPEMLAACRAYVRARNDGGISMADLSGIADGLIRDVVAKLEGV